MYSRLQDRSGVHRLKRRNRLKSNQLDSSSQMADGRSYDHVMRPTKSFLQTKDYGSVLHTKEFPSIISDAKRLSIFLDNRFGNFLKAMPRKSLDKIDPSTILEKQEIDLPLEYDFDLYRGLLGNKRYNLLMENILSTSFAKNKMFVYFFFENLSYEQYDKKKYESSAKSWMADLPSIYSENSINSKDLEYALRVEKPAYALRAFLQKYMRPPYDPYLDSLFTESISLNSLRSKLLDVDVYLSNLESSKGILESLSSKINYKRVDYVRAKYYSKLLAKKTSFNLGDFNNREYLESIEEVKSLLSKGRDRLYKGYQYKLGHEPEPLFKEGTSIGGYKLFSLSKVFSLSPMTFSPTKEIIDFSRLNLTDSENN